MKTLTFAVSMAHTCGLGTMGEALSNWNRSLIHGVYSEIPNRIKEMKADLRTLKLPVPISRDIANMSIYDFNTKYNLGIDFEAEDREMEAALKGITTGIPTDCWNSP